MFIKSLKLSNAGPFRPRPSQSWNPDDQDFSIKFDFDEHVNLFIGPNSSGKSSVLEVLYILTRKLIDERLGGEVSSLVSLVSFAKHDDSASFAIESQDDDLVRYEFHGLLSKIGISSESQIDHLAWNDVVDKYGFIGYSHSDFAIDTGIQAGDIGSQIENQQRLYLQASAHHIAQMQNSECTFDHQVLSVLDGVFARICEGFPITISGEAFDEETKLLQGKSLDEIFIDAMDPNRITMLEDLGGYTSETIDGTHRFTDLSHGTLSTLAWVSRFIIGMGYRYHGDCGWRNKPGIFIIDEIDAHLHPSWQRRIIPTLKEYFPNVQIFASTHSPMMVAGLKAGQVHLLKRDETGTVVWSRNEQDIIGWTADEIYRTFMGIDDPTDERTARHAEDLRRLREKDSLTPEEQEQMQKLRRLVNEDLLAGGHINAQRERYAGLMEQFLRSRMNDLSQDGA